jgi:hypothetical protein
MEVDLQRFLVKIADRRIFRITLEKKGRLPMLVPHVLVVVSDDRQQEYEELEHLGFPLTVCRMTRIDPEMIVGAVERTGVRVVLITGGFEPPDDFDGRWDQINARIVIPGRELYDPKKFIESGAKQCLDNTPG